MDLAFPESEFKTVQLLANRVRHAHFRLVWVAGEAPSVRSRFLAQAAQTMGCPYIAVGSQLASALLEIPPPLRPSSAEETFYDLLHRAGNDILCLDRMEILFDKPLSLKAVDLVKNASRRYTLIASWPGAMEGEGLVFAPADHPSHLRIEPSRLESVVHPLSIS